jgi:hypothetical protein
MGNVAFLEAADFLVGHAEANYRRHACPDGSSKELGWHTAVHVGFCVGAWRISSARDAMPSLLNTFRKW